MGKFRVGGDTDDLGTDSGELVEGLVEGKNFSRANDYKIVQSASRAGKPKIGQYVQVKSYMVNQTRTMKTK